MSVYRMLEEVAATLRPEDSFWTAAQDARARVAEQLRLRLPAADVVLGGSAAKRTALKGVADVDVFVRFPPDWDMDLSDDLEMALGNLAGQRVHGSRDYFITSVDDLTLEIVPVLRITDAGQAKNVTDVSPLHVTYFLRKGADLVDEVRLAKQFARSSGTYGAESYIRGFSGHVLDLLIIHHGSFLELIRAATSWSSPVCIDIEGHGTGKLFSEQPLVVIDPMQPRRNAAAAVSVEQLERFRLAAKRFLASPSPDFFRERRFSEERLLKDLQALSAAATLVHAHVKEEMRPDVAGARIRKLHERCERELVEAGFTMMTAGWNFADKGISTLWYVTQEHTLPRMQVHWGPPATDEDAAARFREKHPDVEVREGRLCTRINRPIRTPLEAIGRARDIIGDDSLSVQARTLGGDDDPE